MKVVIKRVGQFAQVKEIENSLESMQTVVGGYIEMLPMPCDPKMDLVFNEEGKFECKPNIVFPEIKDVLFGDILVVGTNGKGGTIGLTNKQAAIAMIWLDMRGLTNEVI